MANLAERIDSLRSELAEAAQYLRVEALAAKLPQLEAELASPDLWDDADRARQIQTEFTLAKEDLDLYHNLNGQIDDADTMCQLAREESDPGLETEADALVAELSKELESLELRAFFNGEYDEGDAVCEIHSGAGGTDAQDWAEMLFSMYKKWAAQNGYEFEINDVQNGQEAGISSASFVIKGRNCYGWLQAERGVHRLIRISPFDQAERRHTAFASFAVVPFIVDATSQIDIDEKDLRVDVYRSSGAGGQHVNTTDSAVRVTHLPTSTVVSCQNERSQHQNKERCMEMLAMKLVALQKLERKETLASEAGEAMKVEWGSQIRTYVLHPFQQVKDERNGFTVGNPEGVLNGEVGQFMEAWLRWRRAEGLSDAK